MPIKQKLDFLVLTYSVAPPRYITAQMLRFCPLSLKIMEKSIDIRPAVREDSIEIWNLIQELAEFEEMPDGPKIDYDVLEKDGFDGENPLFKCYVAVCDNKIIGYALYFYIYSTLNKKIVHLEDLYVTPDYRQKYVGSRLFHAIAKRTFDENCQYLDFSVLSWNPAQNFYKAKGSIDLTEMEGWHMYRLNCHTLQSIASNCVSDVYQVHDARLEEFDSIKRLAEEAFESRRVRNESKTNEISIAIEENNDFDKKCPYFGYIVVAVNNRVVGYALYCYTYSTWEGKSMYLQEFYVTLNEHKLNMTNDLLSAVAKKAHDEKCSRIDFWLLDPKKAGRFYTSKGAIDLTENEEWHLYRLLELPKKSSL
ncbi:PREDICTED: uncharacterized protein LOC105367934 [Ceratosolen solmsi marchali]|uniref:Uncharacterized protein LOC105367934 n=1 Tax=Ceratosolen solmsi marchali TaxID=326594 RepID=A0AAJ6YVH8_9HYME|nr:PREDICTED: uncharacterized protein LOC105367934 [Ceratosolen solmsi marchali]